MKQDKINMLLNVKRIMFVNMFYFLLFYLEIKTESVPTAIYDSAIFTLLTGLTMLAIYHAGLYNRGVIEDNTIASQKEIIERDKNTIDFMHGYIGFLEDYIRELKERNLEVKSAKTRK